MATTKIQADRRFVRSGQAAGQSRDSYPDTEVPHFILQVTPLEQRTTH